MLNYSKVTDLELRGKRVFIRVDFNVPLKKEGDAWIVTDSTRIEGALPTIRYVMEQGGRVVLASHLGRPKGEPHPDYSMEPVGAKLSEYLGVDVILTDSCIGDGARGLSHTIRDGEVLLLENLRFEKGEEKNSHEFCLKLQELCDIYVSDAFGTLHRAHASTAGLPNLLQNDQRGIGLLVEKELEYLLPLRQSPEKPFVLVMGGSKVSDKIDVLTELMQKADTILIGGAMAYAFLKAAGKKIGKSLCNDDDVKLAEKLISLAAQRRVSLQLPVDHGITPDFKKHEVTYTDGPDIPADQMAVDIGPKTVQLYAEAVQNARTLFWNGPMGVFEVPAFAKGTFDLARIIAECPAKKLAGGGDVAAALSASGMADRFDFISTGGGATLEFLEGKSLPGLKVLEIPPARFKDLQKRRAEQQLLKEAFLREQKKEQEESLEE